MSSRSQRPTDRSTAIALCLLLACVAVAVFASATAHAATYKMVMCAGDAGVPPYATATNTTSSGNPGGIFEFHNYCGGQGGDPPGEKAFLRINENQASGNAAEGAYGSISWNMPPWVGILAGGGYTREPNAFNEGWRGRFWAEGYDGSTNHILMQGQGVQNGSLGGAGWATTSTFAPHLWPYGSYGDYRRFVFEMTCFRPAGCDRSNYNALDANGMVLMLNDASPSQVSFFNTGSPLMQGQWVRGTQGVFWNTTDIGSGIRFERVRIDGDARHTLDHLATGQCNATADQTNGEFARTFSPCPVGGPWGREYDFDSAALTDGTHTLAVCDQDYGQYMGLGGTGGESCTARAIRVDNHPPAAPNGLRVLSPNPARYMDRFGAQFSLPPDSGSPIAKVHYDVINAAGDVVMPEKAIPGTNPSEIAEVAAPAKAGDYRLRVWLEDSVGLRGPASSVPIPRDTTPPAAPQDVSVTAPATTRLAQAFDVRWHDILDNGAPIDAVHYEVVGEEDGVLVPASTVSGPSPEAISDLQTPRGRGLATLRLWLSDAEGNVGAPASVPLAYDCVRSEIGGGVALSAALGEEGLREMEVREGQGADLSGTLRGAGAPVAGAPLCVFSNVLTDSDPQFLGIAMTGSDGRWHFALDPGPSREIEVRYRPDQRELAASAKLLTRVRPTFSVARKVVENGSYARFSGAIPGPHNDRVVVVLQVRSGKGWRAFRRYRTRKGGRFEMRYRFTRTTSASTYVMRAQVRSQAGYPYLQGNSRSLALRVVPKPHRRASCATAGCRPVVRARGSAEAPSGEGTGVAKAPAR